MDAVWKTVKLSYLNNGLSDRHHATLSILSNKNLNRFLLVVKATALKLQISKISQQIIISEASFYICGRPLTDINVTAASVCAQNLRENDICCFKAMTFTTKRN